jgi:hypothetical protein
MVFPGWGHRLGYWICGCTAPERVLSGSEYYGILHENSARLTLG